mgnify:CR=1 FL=1
MTRPAHFQGAQRVVIKIGSSVLRDGKNFDRAAFASLVRGISVLRDAGIECVVVCSGAVALGFPLLGLETRPSKIERLQAAAAVGQGRLMRFWSDELGHYGAIVAQVLLTHDDLKDRRRYLAARHTLRSLLELGAIPVINENDTVAIDEIKLGDNDLLSSQVISLVEGDLLILLSDVDGFYDGDPRAPGSVRVPWVDGITHVMVDAAGGSTTGLGSGGMATKLQAVQQVGRLGVPSIIAKGKNPGVLESLYAGDDQGTWFAASSVKLGRRKHWIAYAGHAQGAVHVDQGAADALVSGGKSLLPIGITRVDGDFQIGDAIEVIDPSGSILARGLVTCDAPTTKKNAGKRTDDIDSHTLSTLEVIHRDDLVLLEKNRS